MKLIGTGLSPYVQRVLLAARHKQIELSVEAPAGGTKSAEHLARNPMGRIPVLVDGDCIVPESEVILGYLEDRVPSPSLWPGDAATRAQARLLTRVFDSYGPTSFSAFLNNDQPGIDLALARTDTCLGYLEQLWQPDEFAAGAAYSAADCALIPFFVIFERLQEGFKTMDAVHARPKVTHWWEQARTSEAGQFASTTLDQALAQMFQGQG